MKELRKTDCRNTRGVRTPRLGGQSAGADLLPRAIGETIFQIVALWFHVGVGPMIGMGPMDRPRFISRRRPGTASPRPSDRPDHRVIARH